MVIYFIIMIILTLTAFFSYIPLLHLSIDHPPLLHYPVNFHLIKFITDFIIFGYFLPYSALYYYLLLMNPYSVYTILLLLFLFNFKFILPLPLIQIEIHRLNFPKNYDLLYT